MRQHSHNRSTSIASIASVSSFKTAHSLSPPPSPSRSPSGLPNELPSEKYADSYEHSDPLEQQYRGNDRRRSSEDMLLTPVSSQSSSGSRDSMEVAKAASIPLPPTPPPRRRTLLLGKGIPKSSPRAGSVDSMPAPPVPESPQQRVLASDSIADPDSPSRHSHASFHSHQSYHSHHSQQSHVSQQSQHSQRSQRQHSQLQHSPVSLDSHAPPAPTEQPDDARWSRPPRSRARQVSKTMQLARRASDEELSSTAPLRPGSASSTRSVRRTASPAPARSGMDFSAPLNGYSSSSQGHGHAEHPSQPDTPSRGQHAENGNSGREDDDEAWVQYVKAQLCRVFPEFVNSATLPDRSQPTNNLRDELSSLRSEMSALRGVVGELRGEIRSASPGGTAPLSPVDGRSNSYPPIKRTPPLKTSSLGLSYSPRSDAGERSFVSHRTAPSQDDVTSVYSASPDLPRRRPPLPPRERLSMYHPSPHEPEVSPEGGLVIFDNESDEPIHLRPSCISLMLDVVRTVDMKMNGIRSDTEIFSDDNLANLAISQVMG